MFCASPALLLSLSYKETRPLIALDGPHFAMSPSSPPAVAFSARSFTKPLRTLHWTKFTRTLHKLHGLDSCVSPERRLIVDMSKKRIITLFALLSQTSSSPISPLLYPSFLSLFLTHSRARLISSLDSNFAPPPCNITRAS